MKFLAVNRADCFGVPRHRNRPACLQQAGRFFNLVELV
jgi:hypothetical protein